MKKLTTFLALGAIATLLTVVSTPAAYAQSNRENSTFTVTEPVEVGSFTLQPGTYLIKVIMLSSDRDAIQVTNEEQTKVFASVLATPHPIRRDEAVPQSRYIYYATGPGETKALRTWFARDASKGHDIVYPRGRAMALAAAAKEPVVAVPDAVKEAEYKTAPLVVVTPEQYEKPYEAPAMNTPAQPAPVAVAEARPSKKLPATASHVPLWAALGLLSLGGAFGLRALGNRMA